MDAPAGGRSFPPHSHPANTLVAQLDGGRWNKRPGFDRNLLRLAELDIAPADAVGARAALDSVHLEADVTFRVASLSKVSGGHPVFDLSGGLAADDLPT